MAFGTADINFITGTPGSGKSLRAVEAMAEIMAANARLPADQEPTLVYASNFTGLNIPGVIDWEDPRDWEQLPPGAILFVDEAQKYFRPSRDLPTYITAMETIRHKGVRLVLVTQQPSYLHSHIRGLCGRHEHLLRKSGAAKTYIFRSDECIENTKSLRSRADGDQETYSFPKECYSLYKSAEIHTRKYEMPNRVKKGLFFLALGGVMLFFVGRFFVGIFTAKADDQVVSSQATPEAGAGWNLPGRSSRVETPEEYAARFTPRLPGLPASAPAYDGFEVKSYPRLLCVASGDTTRPGSTCSCYTEQVTRLSVDEELCRTIVANGYYDPLREPITDQVRFNGQGTFQAFDPPRAPSWSSTPGPRRQSVRPEYQPPAYDRVTGRPTSF